MSTPLEILRNAPPHVWLHIASAVVAIVVGGYLLSRPKGTVPHRFLGRLWVALMLCTAITSFFIQARGQFSPIHILSVISIAAVVAAVVGARKKNFSLHRRSMIGAYSGLFIAGAFTLLPQRMLGKLVFGG